MSGNIKWPDTIRSVVPLRRRPTRLLIYAPFVVLYAISLQWCWDTAGTPYRNAIAHEAAKNATKLKKEAGFASAIIEDDEDEDEMGGVGFMGEDENGDVVFAPSTPPPFQKSKDKAPGTPSKAGAVNETAIVEAMHAAERKLPNPLLPDFWAVLFFFAIFIANALVWFIQRWSLRIKAMIQYQRIPHLEPGCFAYITPHAHQGAAEIVPVLQQRLAGKNHLYIVFQRQKYEIHAEGTEVRDLEMPVGKKLKEYLEYKGFSSRDQAELSRERFGPNSLQIELPSFMATFKKQVLGPVPVFQFFCASLWLLDEYWNYALFNMFAISMYEASTAFGKLKNLQALRGMKHAAIHIKVYRGGAWMDVTTEDLLPGDVFSLAKTGNDDVTVPCDALVLRGGAVVNEASLTGESTPQMKEAAVAEGVTGEEELDIDKKHRVHVLYSGTSLLQCTSPVECAGVISAPDGGCVCYCLRTGFSSSQGKLVRMIEYSQEQVLTDVKEVLALLTLLLCFALMSSGYVLQKGLKEGKRSQYELILRCVLILTSVVPPELPMQTAVAVNTALFALFKASVFCTEPFRIPFAGKVEYALFDKTGTLTTDQLIAVGTWSGTSERMTPMANASKDACVVLATCQSLVKLGDKVVGDPVEMAAISAIGWEYNPETHKVTPGAKSVCCKEGDITVQILFRYHFSSRLQRMSVVASRVDAREGTKESLALVKGSPEAIKKLLATVPNGYDSQYRAMAEDGMRVLALAMRRLTPEEADAANRASKTGKGPAREDVEQGLTFVGFVAFSCLVRRDTAEIVKELQRSSHCVAMATGDAALTALYVGRQVGITGTDKAKGLLLAKTDAGQLIWQNAQSETLEKDGIVYRSREMEGLAKKGFDLCVTGPMMQAAVEADPDTMLHIRHIKIFARMSPDDKEAVLRALKEQGRHTLMCGDGANDVGALKQAHVGLALLSGFGGANTAKVGEKTTDQETTAEKIKRIQEEAAKLAEKQKKINEEFKKDKAELAAMQKARFEEIMAEMTERGEAWAQFKALKQSIAEMNTEMRRRNAERQAAIGGNNPFTAHAAMLAGEAGDDGTVPMVKLGDASVAAPFTSKLPSIKSCVDIIRQGRCTLVSTIQMQQVLALNCLISAYSLSALYLDGVRMGENQMIATGLLLTTASLAFSYARPVQELSPIRPITTIFHPAIWVSIVGQLAIHLGCMMYAISMTRAAVSAEEAAILDGDLPEPIAPPPAPAPGAADGGSLSIPFKPSLLNTVVFLIETAQQVSVMAVNYKGRPFMLASTENRPMGYSLLAVCVGVFVCAFEVFPWFNDLLKLVPMPSDTFRSSILWTLGMSVFGSHLWDRLCVAIFAPRLLWAGYVDAWNAQPPWQEQLAFWKKIAYIAGVIGLYFWTQESLWVLLGGWWGFRKLFGAPPPAAQAPPGADPTPTPGAAQEQAAVINQGTAARQGAGDKKK